MKENHIYNLFFQDLVALKAAASAKKDQLKEFYSDEMEQSLGNLVRPS